MTKLLQIITYKRRNLEELMKEEDRKVIIYLASVLSPLESEIIQFTGMIDLTESGILFTTGYPDELSDKITRALNERPLMV